MMRKLQKRIKQLTKGDEGKETVLELLLEGIIKMKKGDTFGFNFGTKKQWLLKRTK